MAVTETGIKQIYGHTQGLIGQKAWGVALGIGSFVTFEFGAPTAESQGKGRTHGEWHLWIMSCAWRLEKEDVIVGSDDDRARLQEAVQQLEGLEIESLKLIPPAPDATLTFAGGVILRLFPFSFSEDDEHWMLFVPGGNVLSIGPGTSWSFGSASEP